MKPKDEKRVREIIGEELEKQPVRVMQGFGGLLHDEGFKSWRIRRDVYGKWHCLEHRADNDCNPYDPRTIGPLLWHAPAGSGVDAVVFTCPECYRTGRASGTLIDTGLAVVELLEQKLPRSLRMALDSLASVLCTTGVRAVGSRGGDVEMSHAGIEAVYMAPSGVRFLLRR